MPDQIEIVVKLGLKCLFNVVEKFFFVFFLSRTFTNKQQQKTNKHRNWQQLKENSEENTREIKTNKPFVAFILFIIYSGYLDRVDVRF